MNLIISLLLLLSTYPVPASTPGAEVPDLILHHARIWTGESAGPGAEAVAIKGNRISATGKESDILRLAGKETRVLDLGGRFVMPGINDAHTHFLSGSMGLYQVDLVGARSLADVQERVRKFAQKYAAEKWITGRGWEYTITPDKRLPTRADLDAILSDRPVFLRAYDGHTGWGNTKAFQVAGVTAKSKVEGFGEIVIDPATGEPAGSLKEGAQGLISRVIPEPTREQQMAALKEGLVFARSLGITSFQDASTDPEELELYESMAASGGLTCRASMAMAVNAKTTEVQMAQIAATRDRLARGFLTVNSVKIMLDGVIESHTAAMLAPYSDSPSTSGSASMSQEQLNRLVSLADRARLRVLIHAIGDRAVRMSLNAFEYAAKTNGARDSRHRIEHIETVSAADIPRFARLGVLASMMPVHADPGTNGVWEPAVGSERATRAFAWRSLEKAGARLVFSSDWPAVIAVDPIRGIYNAVNRQTPEGEPAGGWIPAQRVSIDTALRAYTEGGAFATFEEKEKGTIATGKQADLVVLDQDLLHIKPADIYKAKVVLTVLDGKIIYDRTALK
jgi:predicted amidohydrolase YtcJ